MDKLTERQKEVYNLLIKQTTTNGFPPSIREIGKALGISTLKGVTCHLEALERKGYIDRTSAARGIKLNNLPELYMSNSIIKLPLVDIKKNKKEFLSMPKEIISEKASYLLRVHGDTMREEAILDGDLLIIQDQPTAKNGEVIVANIGGRQVVSRYFREKGRVRLQPANSKYDSMYVKEDFIISGKVIGLLRSGSNPKKTSSLKIFKAFLLLAFI